MNSPLAEPAASKPIQRAHSVFRRWLDENGLPFWSTTGCDPDGHGFVEHLDLGGLPAPVAYKRMRVQARQIYVFSHASLLGWEDILHPGHCGFDFIVKHGVAETGRWVRRLGSAGGVLDHTADLYDLAFVLFALGWYARATGSTQAIGLARETLGWIKREMPSPFDGFQNTLPIEPGPRQQNPHMHLLEAVLALYETTGEECYAEAVADLIALFQTHLFDKSTGTLGEFFNEDWSWGKDASGTHIEPGHHYEWVWLLKQYETLFGVDMSAEANALYQFANRHGVDPETKLILDVVGRDGAPRQRSSRLWAQTEAIKAHLAMADRFPDANSEVEPIVTNLMRRYFNCRPAGTWIDHLDDKGAAKIDKIPSSSFYHIFMAFAELDKAVKRLSLEL